MTTIQVGVKVLLASETGRFLFLRRSQEKYTDVTELWDIAGGCIDPGERLVDNLYREVLEETGLEVIGDLFLVAAQDIMPRNDLHVVRLTYIARVSNGKIELSDEHVDYRWFTLAELDMLEGLDSNFVKILPKIKEIVAGKVFKNSFTSNITKAVTYGKVPTYLRKAVKILSKYVDQLKQFKSRFTNIPSNLDENIVKIGRGKGDVAKIKRKAHKTAKTGQLGEDVAVRYLLDGGFDVITRNYRKKWGEIDIVAELDGTLHFIEVKAGSDISRGTGYRPEEHVHYKKLERLQRTIQSYLAEKHKEAATWQLDVLAVDLDQGRKVARCRFLENIT
jgi:putative endonuclease